MIFGTDLLARCHNLVLRASYPSPIPTRSWAFLALSNLQLRSATCVSWLPVSPKDSCLKRAVVIPCCHQRCPQARTVQKIQRYELSTQKYIKLPYMIYSVVLQTQATLQSQPTTSQSSQAAQLDHDIDIDKPRPVRAGLNKADIEVT